MDLDKYKDQDILLVTPNSSKLSLLRKYDQKLLNIKYMTLEEYKAISPVFEKDIYEAISLNTCVEKRLTKGAPSKAAMTAALKEYKEYLGL